MHKTILTRDWARCDSNQCDLIILDSRAAIVLSTHARNVFHAVFGALRFDLNYLIHRRLHDMFSTFDIVQNAFEALIKAKLWEENCAAGAEK